MDIAAIVKKYGKLSAIPSDELAQAGYKLVKTQDGLRLQSIALSPELALARKIGRVLDVAPEFLERRSTAFLHRLILVLAEDVGLIYDGDDEPRDFRHLLAHGQACEPSGLEYFCLMLRAKAAGQPLDHLEAKETRQALVGLGIDLTPWETGIGERVYQIGQETIPADVWLKRQAGEFALVLKALVAHDSGALSEVAHRLDCPRDLAAVLDAVGSSKDRLRQALAVAHARLSRLPAEDDLKPARFHAQRLLGSFKRPSGTSDEAAPFFFRWSRKDPLDDLCLGNDAGCCLGIYDDAEDGLGGGVGKSNLPAMFLDPATQFLEIWHGDVRCGLALCFAGTLDDRTPLLVINSIEFSQATERYARQLAPRVLEYLDDLARVAGFKRLAMGSHSYNSGISLGGLKLGAVIRDATKVHALTKRVYGDVLGEYHEGQDYFFEGIAAVGPDAGTVIHSSDDKLTFAQVRDILEVVIGPAQVLERRAGIFQSQNFRYPLSLSNCFGQGDDAWCGFTFGELLELGDHFTGQDWRPGSRLPLALVFGTFAWRPKPGNERRFLWDDAVIHEQAGCLVLPLKTLRFAPDGPSLPRRVIRAHAREVPLIMLLADELKSSGRFGLASKEMHFEDDDDGTLSLNLLTGRIKRSKRRHAASLVSLRVQVAADADVWEPVS